MVDKSFFADYINTWYYATFLNFWLFGVFNPCLIIKLGDFLFHGALLEIYLNKEAWLAMSVLCKNDPATLHLCECGGFIILELHMITRGIRVTERKRRRRFMRITLLILNSYSFVGKL